MCNQMMLYQNIFDIVIIIIRVVTRTRILIINILLIDCREVIEKFIT